MWLWLQRNLPRSIHVWAKLCLFSTTFHLTLLFIIFFIYKGESGGFNFEITKGLLNSDAPVMFMPLHKRIAQKNAGKSGKNLKKSEVLKAQEAAPVQEKNTKTKEKKAEMSTTVVSSDKKKDLAKKKAQQLEAEKKKAEAAKKIELEKKMKEEADAKAKEAEAKKLEEIAKAKVNTAEHIDAQDDIRYMGRQDLDALQMQEFVGAEVGQHWNPPIGVPEDVACEIKLIVDWEGKLKDIKMLKSSEVVIYDVSARNAVKKMSFPKWLWGKEFSITFKQ